MHDSNSVSTQHIVGVDIGKNLAMQHASRHPAHDATVSRHITNLCDAILLRYYCDTIAILLRFLGSFLYMGTYRRCRVETLYVQNHLFCIYHLKNELTTNYFCVWWNRDLLYKKTYTFETFWKISVTIFYSPPSIDTVLANKLLRCIAISIILPTPIIYPSALQL
jgi:hypothetical protein